MSATGGQLFQGNSKLTAEPLGVVKIGFDGWDLGKTTADTNLSPDKDEKDILYQQDGTKASDHVRTGQDYMLSATFGEISTGLLKLLMAGVESSNTDSATDYGVVTRSLYQSMRENEAKPLRVVAVNADGDASEDIEDRMDWYEAIPIISGELINWGADTQRNFPVEFRIKWHKFDDGESSTYTGAFGYWGDPTSSDVPATDWSDKSGGAINKAEATDATTIEVTFDKNMAFQTAYDASDYSVKVNDKFVSSTAGVIATNVLTLTFAASTFANGDAIELSIGGAALQDTATTPNTFSGVNDKTVLNSVA